MLKPHILSLPARRLAGNPGLPVFSGRVGSGRSAGFAAEVFARHVTSRDTYPEALLVFLEPPEQEIRQQTEEVHLTQLTLRLALQLCEVVQLAGEGKSLSMEVTSLHQSLTTCLTALETRSRETVREIRQLVSRLEKPAAPEEREREIMVLRQQLLERLEQCRFPLSGEGNAVSVSPGRPASVRQMENRLPRALVSPSSTESIRFQRDLTAHRQQLIQLVSAADEAEQEAAWQILSRQTRLTVRLPQAAEEKDSEQEMTRGEQLIRLIDRCTPGEYRQLVEVLAHSLPAARLRVPDTSAQLTTQAASMAGMAGPILQQFRQLLEKGESPRRMAARLSAGTTAQQTLLMALMEQSGIFPQLAEEKSPAPSRQQLTRILVRTERTRLEQFVDWAEQTTSVSPVSSKKGESRRLGRFFREMLPQLSPGERKELLTLLPQESRRNPGRQDEIRQLTHLLEKHDNPAALLQQVAETLHQKLEPNGQEERVRQRLIAFAEKADGRGREEGRRLIADLNPAERQSLLTHLTRSGALDLPGIPFSAGQSDVQVEQQLSRLVQFRSQTQYQTFRRRIAAYLEDQTTVGQVQQSLLNRLTQWQQTLFPVSQPEKTATASEQAVKLPTLQQLTAGRMLADRLPELLGSLPRLPQQPSRTAVTAVQGNRTGFQGQKSVQSEKPASLLPLSWLQLEPLSFLEQRLTRTTIQREMSRLAFSGKLPTAKSSAFSAQTKDISPTIGQPTQQGETFPVPVQRTPSRPVNQTFVNLTYRQLAALAQPGAIFPVTGQPTQQGTFFPIPAQSQSQPVNQTFTNLTYRQLAALAQPGAIFPVTGQPVQQRAAFPILAQSQPRPQLVNQTFTNRTYRQLAALAQSDAISPIVAAQPAQQGAGFPIPAQSTSHPQLVNQTFTNLTYRQLAVLIQPDAISPTVAGQPAQPGAAFPVPAQSPPRLPSINLAPISLTHHQLTTLVQSGATSPITTGQPAQPQPVSVTTERNVFHHLASDPLHQPQVDQQAVNRQPIRRQRIDRLELRAAQDVKQVLNELTARYILHQAETRWTEPEKAHTLSGYTARQLEQRFSEAGSLSGRTRQIVQQAGRSRSWSDARSQGLVLPRQHLTVKQTGQTMGWIAEAPIGGPASASGELIAARPAAPRLQPVPAAPQPPELALRREQSPEAIRETTDQSARKQAEMVVRQQTVSIGQLHRQAGEQREALEAQQKALTSLQQQVESQQALLQKSMEKTLPGGEAAQIRTIARQVMKEMEGQLRLERQRRGLL